MAHRRKSSHPVCKTRRNLELTIQDVNDDDDDSDLIDSTQSRDHSGNHGNTSVTVETDDEDGQQIVLPSDLFKDFEAIRSQTKLDATNLMRRLLKDYQSISTVGDKPLQGQSEEHVENDIHGNQNLPATTSIAKDVSLATARVDTDDDQYQGLDLSVGTRKISSQLFDTKSLNSEPFEQPLDLSCTKTPTTKDSLSRESPSSSQLDISSVNNEFNYVYVYPGLYPPTSGVMSNDDIEADGQAQNISPVPELLLPGKLVSPDSLSRAQFVSSSDIPDNLYAGAQTRYRDFTTPVVQRQTSPASPLPKLSPTNIKQEPTNIKQEPGEISYRMSENQGQHFQSGQKPRHLTGSSPPGKGGKKECKKSSEMKVISENTTAGVYTSVMKLPWSRRTRTKKPKHKVKLEDTLIPQFMLEQGKTGSQIPDWNPSQVSPGNTSSDQNPVAKTPECSESVMMVYPSGGTSAYGKPVRKRGRPPKLPMLAKLLQNQQGGKKSKQEKQSEDMQAQITQQVQANGGMVVYNAGGQIMTAFGGMPLQQAPTSSPSTDEQPMPTPVMPNMAQAQLIGQIPLSQLTGGPIQFLGQFPAQALPFPGQLLQTVPAATSEGPGQQQPAADDQDQNVSKNDAKEVQSESPPKTDTVPQVNYQYAFQPMFIPAGALPLPVPPPVSMPATVNDVTPSATEETPQTSDSSTVSDSSGTVNMSQGASTHVMKLEGSNTISTMSTTSISNTGSGAIYQEMILSSKSLVDVKKRRRQTAIQMLKSKSGDQNFLCTSFRIRPRLVAQAQAQKERLAAKGVKEEYVEDEMEFSDPKNLIRPQNDSSHFGENNNSELCDIDFANIQIKQEIDPDELYEKVKEIAYKNSKQETNASNEDTLVKTENPAVKRYMLKGSQKRKAKFYGSRIVNDAADIAAINGNDQTTNANEGNDTNSSDLFQELFNCKVCNKIISVDDMEAHSLEHMNKNFHCQKCGQGYNESQLSVDEFPKCPNCNETLTKLENSLDCNDTTIACDECPETFKSLPEFYEHKTGHKNDQTAQGGFECDFCGKVYQYYHALQFHRRTHRERKVPCLDKACDMKFRSRKEMELHFDSKHPEKKEYFHCVYEGCTKKFLKNFHLQEHIRVKHYNIKAFQCPWPGCLKEFAAQRHLKIHLLIHRDEKPMKCDHCDYRCRQRSAMNWHMRKHPDVPYKYKRATKSPSVSKSESE
ncbi:uncharacterized protein LOC123527887 [Mercenaria mercenaria]|uniref:uncharacterized protein LOC123527887 n=1 Tax=Mercenaria mercenaria TaxID=6596 RepID=UPI00234EBCC2|nr:uncharacterized protein LOC123527887 [Mercenaria mercenaria]